MSHTYGVYGPKTPRLGELAYRLARWLFERKCAQRGFYRADSGFAREQARTMRERLARGERIHLLGIGAGGHNSGIALVRASRAQGVELLANNEEERFSGKKHCADFPVKSIDALKRQMADMGVGPKDIHACVATWDFPVAGATGLRCVFDHVPASLSWLLPKYQVEHLTPDLALQGMFESPRLLGEQLGLGRPFPIIGLNHHRNHAYFAYAASPFAGSEEPVMVAVIDGNGDESAISLYEARGNRMRLIHDNRSIVDSLGHLYALIAMTQGGWTVFSCEGRYMGAAAWGNTDRLTNPYYMRLRQILYFGARGEIRLNRAMANWHVKSALEPYTAELKDILGPPIPKERLWNPDAVLNVDDVKHAEITRERVDKAAALQLVFEDALAHVIGALIQRTGSRRLVLTGGCALNCVGSMRLLEHFNEEYYERYFGKKNTRLHLWVPPTPNDTGVTMGAAYQFAMAHGDVPCGPPLQHAFYCGPSPSADEIAKALQTTPEIGFLPLDRTACRDKLDRVADLMSYIVAAGGVIGLFQGPAETGPRALGHRSILANPCSPHTLELLNELVKRRERIRPLAPMATYEAAQRYFELLEGGSDGDYNVYNYMVLTARARPEAYERIPAVIHKDGTGRVQIVRRESDPLTHAYLKAMGRRVGVEVSVNTSLNVGGPIAQTPQQALEAMKRSFGMTGMFFISAERRAFVAWHDVSKHPKDAGATLRRWLEAWEAEPREPVADVARVVLA